MLDKMKSSFKRLQLINKLLIQSVISIPIYSNFYYYKCIYKYKYMKLRPKRKKLRE